MSNQSQVHRQRNKTIFTILLFMEGVLAFSLGVFGNKVADLLELSTEVVVIGALVLAVLLFIVTLGRIRYENDEGFLSEYSNTSVVNLVASRIATVFPASLILSIIIGFLCISFIGRGEPIVFFDTLIWNYEVASYLVASVLIYYVSSNNRDYTIILSFAFGLATGLSGTFILLRPFENGFSGTFTGWVVVMFLTGLLINSQLFHNSIDSFRRLFKPQGSSNSGK